VEREEDTRPVTNGINPPEPDIIGAHRRNTIIILVQYDDAVRINNNARTF
jgi:hypothetical protein